MANAATRTWTNATTTGLGDFNTAVNWSNGVPGSADLALFPATSGLNANPNLSASLTVSQVEFDQGGYTLSGNSTSTTLTVTHDANGNIPAVNFSVAGAMTINAPLVFGSTSSKGQQIYSKGTMTINGPISSIPGFDHLIYQAGTIYVNGTNTYSGYTQIQGGTVQFNADSALGNSTGIYTHYNGAFGNQIMVFAYSATNYARPITADTQWFLGVTSGNTLSFAPNAIVLNPANVGFTKSLAGTLQLAADNQFGTGALNMNSSTAGILDLNGFNDTVASLSASSAGPKIINSSNAPSLLTVTGGTGTVALQLGGGAGVANNFAVTYAGSGVLTLSGANTFSGGLNVSSGTVQSTKGAGNSYLGAGDVTVASGATLDLDGSSALILGAGLLGGAGTITNSVTNNASLSFRGTDTNTFSGLIADGTNGPISITLGNGSVGGVQTFSGTNACRGTTTINAGTLFVNGTTVGQSNYTVGASGTLGGTGAIGLGTGNKVTVNGAIRPGLDGKGTLTIGGNLTLSGASASAVFKVAGTTAGQYGLLQGTPAPGEAVTFAGRLNVDFTGLTTGGSLKIFDFDSYSGSFATTNFTGLDAKSHAYFEKTNGVLSFTIPAKPTAIFLY